MLENFRQIHIHLRFLFFDFSSENNHRELFMRLDTLTESILTRRMHWLGKFSVGIWLSSSQ